MIGRLIWRHRPRSTRCNKIVKSKRYRKSNGKKDVVRASFKANNVAGRNEVLSHFNTDVMSRDRCKCGSVFSWRQCGTDCPECADLPTWRRARDSHAHSAGRRRCSCLDRRDEGPLPRTEFWVPWFRPSACFYLQRAPHRSTDEDSPLPRSMQLCCRWAVNVECATCTITQRRTLCHVISSPAAEDLKTFFFFFSYACHWP